ncbi:hypothetical protein VK70_17800 [Paenibacillus durus ATCC 35681]|uniref:DUF4145 domain-containing protein n=2 Tax=Paenibacillus durus TaxID=44251 RepID=A0A0F7FBS6_PAEDU|nr:hypothetical protein VK70_17800 [Paenibacillus durus ATCC 35681]
MSKFYLVEFMENSDDYYEGILYISPGSNRRKPIKGIESYPEFNKGLVRAYNSTINVFNLGEWTATSILCRRLLEGITKSILPETEQYRPLARQLEILPNKVDLDKPILTLAHAIRIGGNLGAHFDLEKEPNYETSKYMVDLLEYLIEYLFILPHRIKELNEHIENLKNEKIDSNP